MLSECLPSRRVLKSGGLRLCRPIFLHSCGDLPTLFGRHGFSAATASYGNVPVRLQLLYRRDSPVQSLLLAAQVFNYVRQIHTHGLRGFRFVRQKSLYYFDNTFAPSNRRRRNKLLLFIGVPLFVYIIVGKTLYEAAGCILKAWKVLPAAMCPVHRMCQHVFVINAGIDEESMAL